MQVRRTILKGIAACYAASALLGSSAAAHSEPLSVQLSWLVDAGSIGEVVALQKGYFADRGLDVELLPGGPTANAIQELLGGTVDIAVGYAPQIMYAANNKLPIISFAATFQKAPLTFFSLGEKNIMSIKDWKGMRIGSAQSALPQVIAILDYNGLSLEDITFVQAQVPALLQDQVDVVGAWPTNTAALEPVTSNPGGYNTQSIWDNGLQFQSNYLIATKPTLDEKADLLAAYLEAVDAGWSFAADNPGEAIDILVAYAPALNPEKERAALDVMVSEYVFTDETMEYGFGNVSSERWQQTLDTYIAIGEIDSSMTHADVFDSRILDSVETTKR
ncbi:MAG: ABC transporter substrate-binding protein [Paracoccaceae bacterium]|nr:ABC transporter substrate-binding protein [Paracoccaceae bacterium]MDE2914760.1 ABC transporter substrate-binding protein [Paracoccaceae bacterium]